MASLALTCRGPSSLCSLPVVKSSRLSTRQAVQCRRLKGPRASSETTESESPAPAPPPAPKEVSLYTGYIKTDSAGVSVIDVVEPTVYVASSGGLEEEETRLPAILGAVLALAGAAVALIFLNGSTPTLEGALTLTEYVQKFNAEFEAPVTAAAPVLEIVEVEAVAPAVTIAEPALTPAAPVAPSEVEAVTLVEAVVTEPAAEPSVGAVEVLQASEETASSEEQSEAAEVIAE